jgi:hypothetical protein
MFETRKIETHETDEKPMINTAPCLVLLRTKPTSTTPSNTLLHVRLTVRLLVPCACAGTAELLGLAPPVVGNEEGAVVLDKGLLKLVLGVLIDEFLVVGDDGFGNGLTDSVDLRSVTTAGDADADIDIGCFHKNLSI